MLNVQKELRKLDIFVNYSLHTNYRDLWSKAKRFHSLKRITSVYYSGDTVKIKSVKIF